MVSTEVTDTFQKIKEQQEKGRYCGVSLKYFFPDFRELRLAMITGLYAFKSPGVDRLLNGRACRGLYAAYSRRPKSRKGQDVESFSFRLRALGNLLAWYAATVGHEVVLWGREGSVNFQRLKPRGETII